MRLNVPIEHDYNDNLKQFYDNDIIQWLTGPGRPPSLFLQVQV